MKTKKLLRLFIAFACAALLLGLAIFAYAQSAAADALGGTQAGAPAALLAEALPASEIVAIAVGAAAVVAVGIAIACTFISKKDKSEEREDEAEESPKKAAKPAAKPTQKVEPKKEPEPEEEEEAEEEPAPEEIEEEQEDEPVPDKAEEEGEVGISLKESLALAAAHAQIKINKKSVADWLKQNYGNEVQLNCRKNMTKTGLPLADTHYVTEGAKKKCFIYVYDLGEGSAMLLLKTNDETAAKISEKYPRFVRSRFPKSRAEKWYTLIPDGGFESADEVFDVIALVLANYTDSLRQVSDEVRREIARLEKLKKSNVTAEEAKSLVSDEAAGVLVTGTRHRRSGKKFAVNIDTLSAGFAAEDVVDMQSLKQKAIVPRGAKQVKILARGTLDKPLTVIADDFSADAVKMIVLTGGEAQWS